MSDSIQIKSISQFRELIGVSKPLHPKVSIDYGLNIDNMSGLINTRLISDLYFIIYKKGNCGNLVYGRNSYDFEEGTLLFLSPGQVIKYEGDQESDQEHQEEFRLAFHPDLILNSELGREIDNYSFFNYDLNEGLHISDKEKLTIEEILSKIEIEYNQNIDKHSQSLIVSNIQLLLNYCLRFYDRQFYTRKNINSDYVTKFELGLKNYYSKENDFKRVPNLKYCAEQLNLSPNYLSDLLKKETGRSAQEHIHNFIIEKAKNLLLGSEQSVSEIAYSLGFEYPSSFSSLFKNKTGVSPKEYRTD